MIEGRPDNLMKDNTVLNDIVLNEECVANHFEPVDQCTQLLNNYFFMEIETNFTISYD